MKTLLALLLPWLSGLTLHPATGPAVHVPLPAEHAATSGCSGRRRAGAGCSPTSAATRKVVLLLRGHRLTTIRKVADPQDGTSFLLAADGTRVVELDAPTTRRTDVWTFDLSGQHPRHLVLRGWAELLGL